MRAAPKPLVRWRASIALAIAVIAVTIAWLAGEPILQQLATWWVVSDEPKQADAIVVLGGDFDVRPFAAATLYKRGFASQVLVSNVHLGRAERLGFIPSHTELNREVLLKLDVPETAIVTFGENLSSTQEEAVAVREWAQQSQAKRIIIPTEQFAARRTRWVFERELAPIDVDVIVYAIRAEQYTISDWWRSRSGLVDFNNEVLKYLYYRARH